MAEIVEPGTKPRPVVLPATSERGHLSEFDVQTQSLSHRYGVSLPHAAAILRLLRGGWG